MPGNHRLRGRPMITYQPYFERLGQDRGDEAYVYEQEWIQTKKRDSIQSGAER